MNPDDIARILDELGERLGPAGSYVFALAVRQVYVDAVVGVVLLVFALIPLLFVRRIWRWVDAGGSYSERGLFSALAGIGYAIVLVIVVSYAASSIPAILNPEYAALTDILSRIVP